jgi:hypothetical protein
LNPNTLILLGFVGFIVNFVTMLVGFMRLALTHERRMTRMETQQDQIIRQLGVPARRRFDDEEVSR